jgi:membrane protein DedA with SNARE-associated domain
MLVPELAIASAGTAELWSYLVLFVGVAVSWIGVPIVGGAALAAAGVLAGGGQVDVWLVVLVAVAGAWVGGYVGYLIGVRAGAALVTRPGRWQRQRRHAMRVGKRFYRRWGPLAVFLTPTWVSGALRMPRRSFLIWNAAAASVSTVVAVFGAYAVATALFDQLTAARGIVAVLVVLTAGGAAGAITYRRHTRSYPD